MRRVDGLDGLRAVAVIAVVLFHAEVPGASGGFLGVSLFFTLSGFLITTLLIAEHDASGSISLRKFYGRRARRLLPAAYVCLLAVAACGFLWSSAQLRHLRGDLLASVANVANWRFAFAPSSYQDLFTSAPSPVAHFWSLAIEEQVYLVVPIVVLVALRRGRWALLLATSGLLAASVAATLATTDRDLVYNGTHTRAAEVLVGMLLAQLLLRRTARSEGQRRSTAEWLPGVVACGAFVTLVVVASVDQAWVYRGGLPVVAVLSAALIWLVMDGRFPARALTVAPLVAIGKVSYGIYLFHWPVFLLIDHDRTGLDGVALFTVRCLMTAALTVVVYRAVEQPVRHGRRRRDRSMAPAMAVAGVIVAVCAVLVVPAPDLTQGEQLLALGEQPVVEFSPSDSVAPDETPAVADQTSSLPVAPTSDVATVPTSDAADPAGASSPPAPLSTATPTALPVAEVVVVGSERAAADALDRLDGVDVLDATRPDCPLSVASTEQCAPLDEFLAPHVAARPDVVVVATGIAESRDAFTQRVGAVTDAQIGDLGRTEEAGIAAIVRAIDLASESGATIVWYTPAHPMSDFYRRFQRIAVMRPETTTLSGPAWELADVVASAVEVRTTATTADEPTRVVVIGDSTSLYLAQALDEGSDGRVSVLWAGANGCPIGPVVATRDDTDGPWIPVQCEGYDTKLPPIVADFDPDAVVVMTGPTELNDQRYADGTDSHAGEEAFAAHRERGFERILATLGPQMPVLVVDAPALRPGRFTKGPMVSVERLAAVNAQVVDWATRHEQVGLFEYRDTLEAAEAAQGSLRSDGMHADPEPLEELARAVYVDRTLAQIDALRAILRP